MKKYKLAVSIISLLFLINTVFASCKKEVHPVSVNDSVKITINGIEISVELAITREEHRQGLMYREKLEKNHGMLFIFPEERRVSFWMKNTLIPLSIAFIKPDGWISQIDEMEPQSLESHLSEMNVKYVLEMNKGWFKENGINVGDSVVLGKEIKKVKNL